MSGEVSIYQEQMTAEEISFLAQKDEQETKNFFKVMSIFMVICFILPFIVAWFRALDGAENPFSWVYYFLGVLYLLCFLALCAYLAYRRSLLKIKRDIKENTKTIERTTIKRKQYMPHNKTYYFFLESSNKLSIEVTADDYERMRKGDELSIEYSTYAKFYFGYF